MSREFFGGTGAEMTKRFGSPEAILEVLHNVRQSLLQLLQSVNLEPTKGRENARALGIDRNLTWRISKIITAEDILSAITEIPTSVHVEKICRACEALGAPAIRCDEARKAVAVFERVVEESADNRENFEAMVSGFATDDVTQRQMNARKMIFLGNIAVWGVQARVNFKTMIYLPNETGEGRGNAIGIEGLVDFKRSRPCKWPIYRSSRYDDEGNLLSNVKTEPICQKDDLPHGLPLLLPFCSDRLPEIIPIKSQTGMRYDVAPSEFGNAGATTIVFAETVFDFVGTHRDPSIGDLYLASINDLYTPSEVVLHDVFVHRDLGIDSTPEIFLLDRLTLPRDTSPEEDEHNQLPLSVKVVKVTAGPGGSTFRPYPEYSGILNHIFEKKGLNSEDFSGYRFTLTYPTVPSAVLVQIPLPEKDRGQ